MGNWGLKVFKQGASEYTTDIRDLIMSSKYSMLKYHSDHSVFSTINPGDYNSYVDIPHNLNYVPAFIAYFKDLDGKLYYIPGYPYGIDFKAYAYAYATKSIIRCGVRWTDITGNVGGYNQNKTASGNTATNYWNSYFDNNGSCQAGDEGGTNSDGAIRFTNVLVPNSASIVSASIDYEIRSSGSGPGNLDINHYGIDEDNTGAFSSNPLGRTVTAASGNLVRTVPSEGSTMNITMTNQVQEIVNRAGWASGNAMGFILRDNGSPDGVYAYTNINGSLNKLTITYGSAATYNFRVIIFKDKLTV